MSAMAAFRSKMLRSMSTFHRRPIRERAFGEDPLAPFLESFAFQLEWAAASLNALSAAGISGDFLPLEDMFVTQF
jgi:hypothetical protein